jgi:hypothetical protein
VKGNFISIMERKTGFVVEVDSVFFSPSGRVSGRGMKLKGGEEHGGVVFRVQAFEMVPKENIYKALWQKRQQFQLIDVHYEIEARNIDVDFVRENHGFSLSDVNLELKGEELALELRGFVMSVPDGYVLMESMTLDVMTKKWALKIEQPSLFRGESERWSCSFIRCLGWRLAEVVSWNNVDAELVLAMFDDLRLADVEVVSSKGQLELNGLRIVSMGERSLRCSSQGLVNGQPVRLESDFYHHGQGEGELNIELVTALMDSPLRLNVQGKLNSSGPWGMSISQDESLIKLDLTRDAEGGWLCTFDGELKKFVIPRSEWSAISSPLSGGIAFKEQVIKATLSGQGVEGGPAKTYGGYYDFKGKCDLDKGYGEIEYLKLGEEGRWGGEASALIGLQPLSLKAFDVNVRDFPLGQYSPKVEGELTVRGDFSDNLLNVEVEIPQMLPDKDQRQKMEDFSVKVDVDDHSVLFVQQFLQKGIDHEIRVKVKTERLLFDPLKVREGLLVELKSTSPLFELQLKDQVPVSINAEGVRVDSFEINDALKRLRYLRGEATIPFFNPSRLDIKADGLLDLKEMEPIAGHRMEGEVRIEGAVWNKSWSLKKLNAPLSCDEFRLIPRSHLPQMEGRLKGRLLEHRLELTEIDLSGDGGESIWGVGRYHLRERELWAKLSATALAYESEDYMFNADVRDLLIEGKPMALSIAGEVHVNDFLYHGDFGVMGDGGVARRYDSKPPESQGVEHQLNLSISSDQMHKLENNSSKVSFEIESLKLHGPLQELLWKGKLKGSGKGDRLFLPLTWLDVGFEAKEIELTFNSEQGFDPNLHLRGEALVDGIQVRLAIDDHLSDLSEGRFSLSSNPSYTKDELLALLSSGESPKKTALVEDSLVESGGGQGSGAAVTLLKRPFGGERGPKGLSYWAGLSGDDGGRFDFRIDYRLGKHFGIELSQSTDRRSQLGLRYTKQVDSLFDLVKKEDLVDFHDQEKDVGVTWHFSGLNPIEKLALRSDLIKALAPVSDALVAENYEVARRQMLAIMVTELELRGYANADIQVRWLTREVNSISRKFATSDAIKENIHVGIRMRLGPQISCAQVEVKGWPEGVAIPKMGWLKKSHLRTPLFDQKELQNFKESLLFHLSERGHLAAKIKSLQLEPIGHPEVESIGGGVTSFVVSPEENELHRGTLPHRLVVDIEPGTIYRISQVVCSGVQRWNIERLLKKVGYEKGRLYSDAFLDHMLSEIKSEYEGDGFFSTRVRLTHVLKSRRYPRVSVHIQVEEGEKWLLGEIKFEGCKHCDEGALRSVIPLEEGQAATPHLLRTSTDRLTRLPQVSTVEYRWQEVSKEDHKDLVLSISEVPLWRFSSALGIERREGLLFNLGLQRENLWGGGESVEVENLFSRRESTHILRYNWPFGELYGKKGRFLLAYREELLSNQEVENRKTVTSLSVFEIEGRKGWGLDLIFQEDENVINDKVHSIRLRASLRESSSLAPSQPAPGWGWGGQGELVSYVNNHELAYIGEYRLSYGFKVGESLLTPWLKCGHGVFVGSGKSLPFSDRFFMGGTRSIRGYHKSEISGEQSEGGQAFTSMGLEYAFPLSSWFDGLVFYDWGEVYDHRLLGGVSQVASAMGIGALFRTPVGPIEAFYAHPRGEGLGRLGLQLGTVF